MIVSKISMDLASKAGFEASRDAQAMHRILTGLFGSSREDAELLYKTQMRGNALNVYMYSNRRIDRRRLCDCMSFDERTGERDATEWLESIEAGKPLRFEVTTYPSQKVATGKRNKVRVPIKQREKRTEWLSRQLREAGCILHENSLCEKVDETVVINHKAERGGLTTLQPYNYSGYISVVDAEKLRNAVRKGIGPEKAYGLGMLSLTTI